MMITLEERFDKLCTQLETEHLTPKRRRYLLVKLNWYSKLIRKKGNK